MGQGGADEACGAGDEDFHGVLRARLIIAHLRAWEVFRGPCSVTCKSKKRVYRRVS
jgi:hypothetical protein